MEEKNESLLSDSQSADETQPKEISTDPDQTVSEEDPIDSIVQTNESCTAQNDVPTKAGSLTPDEQPSCSSSSPVASTSQIPSPSNPDTTSPRKESPKSGRTSTETSPFKSQRPKSVTKSPRNISPIEERSNDESSVVSGPETNRRDRFRPGILIAILSVHWLLSAAIFVTALVLALVPPDENHACYSYFWIVYLRLAFWFFTYVQHDFIKAPCRKLINDNFSFYMDLSFYRKAPLQIVSFWNTMLLAAQNYIKTLFNVQQRFSNICAHIGDDQTPQHSISPQMFVAVFCGLETLALMCFYLPGIVHLGKALRQRDGISFNRTLSNLDDIPITWRLKRQAEQVKLQHIISRQLRHEAEDLGLFDDA